MMKKSNEALNTNDLFREENSIKPHSIPLGAIVRYKSDDSSNHDDGIANSFKNGLPLFVVAHLRDCDNDPLYSLSSINLNGMDSNEYIVNEVIGKKHCAELTIDEVASLLLKVSNQIITKGYSEDVLEVVN